MVIFHGYVSHNQMVKVIDLQEPIWPNEIVNLQKPSSQKYALCLQVGKKIGSARRGNFASARRDIGYNNPKVHPAIIPVYWVPRSDAVNPWKITWKWHTQLSHVLMVFQWFHHKTMI